MGLDLKIFGSMTNWTPDNPKYKDYEKKGKGGWSNEVINDIRWSEFIELTSEDWAEAVHLVKDAPLFTKENGDVDFTWDTGIYTSEELVKLVSESNSQLAIKIQGVLLKQPNTNYFFVQIF